MNKTIISLSVALALSGVVLQSLLRNALADPYILGISAGASTGAVAVAILGIGAVEILDVRERPLGQDEAS